MATTLFVLGCLRKHFMTIHTHLHRFERKTNLEVPKEIKEETKLVEEIEKKLTLLDIKLDIAPSSPT